MAKKTYTADDLRDRLRRRFNASGMAGGYRCVTLDEVASGTGARCDSWIDVAVFELWPSKGLIRRAIEIKVSRSDFLRELENKDKNEWARECFHEFWFCAPSDVVKEQELPEGVGLYAPHGDTVCVKRAARCNETARLDDQLLASFMRSAHKAIHCEQHAAVKRAFAEDKDHLRGKMVTRVVERFLKAHGEGYYSWKDDEEKLYEKLTHCTMDAEAKKKGEAIQGALHRFRRVMREAFPWFTALAYHTLGECDELSKRIFEYWGMKDDDAWSHIIAEAKKNGKSKDAKAVLQQIRHFAEVSGLPFGRAAEAESLSATEDAK